MAQEIKHDPYQSLRVRDYSLLLTGNFFTTLGDQMLTIALGWELYERTHSAFLLGLVGLVQVVPAIFLSLYAGYITDRFNRKRIIIATQIVIMLASLGLTVLSYVQGPLPLIYGCLLVMGVAMTLNTPAAVTLAAYVVPEEAFENAATWSSSSWQLATVIGPALGGVVIAVTHAATLVYALNAVAALTFVFLLLPIKVRPNAHSSTQSAQEPQEASAWLQIREGLRFLQRTPVLLGAITLDLFAVLFGGATTLLPIVAQDVLRVGPEGLGILRAAPSVGALCMAVLLAHRPPFQRAGHTLLLAVAGFGAATIVFGLSRSFWLSLLMLFVLGALDNISVVIRSTLSLTRTPDALRGRVEAVNSLFIAGSNQLGGFESGLTAQVFGSTLSIAGGGVGTIVVVGLVALVWPELRRMRTLRIVQADEVKDDTKAQTHTAV